MATDAAATDTVSADTPTTDISDVEKRVIKQIEYYFGDINLPKDRFLQEQVKEDNGWVTLETMIKFNRLKQICDDTVSIGEAMKKSTTGLVEVSEDGTKVRRCPDKPMPENTEQRRQEIAAKTVYAKGFPLDTSLEVVQEFFEKNYGEMDSIFLRKDEKKAFKGSVFATFKNGEDAQKFLKEEAIKFNDTDLESWKLKSDYYKDKGEEKRKLQKEKEEKKEKAQNRQEEDEKKRFENQITKGAMLHLTGFADETTREDIKNLLQDYGPIAWVDFNKGDKEGWVRYDQENKAKDVLEKVTFAMNDEILLNGNRLDGRVLDGEEELGRWKKMFDEIREKRENKRKRYGGGNYGGNNRGGMHKGRNADGKKQRWGKRPCKAKRDAAKALKLSGGDDADGGNDGEPPAKQAKTESAGGD